MKKLIVGLLLLAFVDPAFAQTPPVTFGASVTNANGSLTTTLSWNAPGAISCTASGHANWTGPTNSISGTLVLPTINLSGTYPLGLSCVFPGDDDATITWIPPTANTDGSSLTDLAGYKIWWGRTATTMHLSEELGAGVTTHRITGLASGDWYFAMEAKNSLGVFSETAPVPPAKLTLNGTQTTTASVRLTVNPVPKAVTDFKVE